jgi:hypothetical protein
MSEEKEASTKITLLLCGAVGLGGYLGSFTFIKLLLRGDDSSFLEFNATFLSD